MSSIKHQIFVLRDSSVLDILFDIIQLNFVLDRAKQYKQGIRKTPSGIMTFLIPFQRTSTPQCIPIITRMW